MNGLQMMNVLLNDVEDEVNLTRVGLETGSLGSTFLDALAQAEDISSRFENRKIKIGNTVVDLDEHGTPILIDKEKDQALWFSPWAFAQLGDKLGMGATQYMKKCLLQGHNDLVPTNMNRWIDRNAEKELLVRIYDGNLMKGILSTRYATLNHDDVLYSMQEVLGSGQYALESYSITPDNMQLRLVDPEKVIVQRQTPRGTDRSTAGMVVRNGMTGMSSVSVEFLVYTFFCTNGLVVADDRGMVYQRKHYAIDKDRFVAEVSETFEGFPDYVIAARDHIEIARNTRLDLEKRIELFELVKKDLRCGDQMLEEIKDTMEKNWDRTAWGLSGAITEVAQKMSSERQYEFERYAGALMHKLAA